MVNFFQSERPDLDSLRKLLKNPMCSEFGISTEEELDHFIAEELPNFRLVRRAEPKYGLCDVPQFLAVDGVLP